MSPRPAASNTCPSPAGASKTGFVVKKRKQSTTKAATAPAAVLPASLRSSAPAGAGFHLAEQPSTGVDMSGWPMDKPGAASLKEDLPCKAPGDRRLLALLEAACREERNNVSLAFAAARPSVPMAVAEALDEFLLQVRASFLTELDVSQQFVCSLKRGLYFWLLLTGGGAHNAPACSRWWFAEGGAKWTPGRAQGTAALGARAI